MKRLTHPHFIGFDQLFQELTNGIDAPKYPPYNVAHLDDETTIVEMAVTGVPKDNLKVEQEGRKLIITGTPTYLTPFERAQNKIAYGEMTYSHRGLSNKQFCREFNMSENIEIDQVIHENGVLYIKLLKVVPEEQKRKLIDIQ